MQSELSDQFNKVLTRPEARHRYWHIHKSDRGFFPPALETFKLEFDGKTFEMRVNHKDDIMTGQIYARHRFLEGDRITVKKKNDNLYSLDAPDTELYPDV